MRIASGLRAPKPKPSSGVSQRPSGDNLPDHRGSELVDNLLPTHNRTSFPGGFRFQFGSETTIRIERFCSEILHANGPHGDSPSLVYSRTSINHIWSIRVEGRKHP